MNRKPILTSIFGLLVVASASAFAPFDDKDKDKPADPKPTGDLAKFQGKWTGKFGPNGGLDAKITITGKTVEFKILTPDGQDFTLNGEIKVNEVAKPFKTIDWVNFKFDDNGIPDNLGIYKIEDADTIKLCLGGPSNARPSEFKSEEGGPQETTLKRVVDKEEEKGATKVKGGGG